MEKYQLMEAYKELAIAYRIMAGRNGSWNTPMTVDDHVTVKFALDKALTIVQNEIRSRMS